MAKIKKIQESGETIYPATIFQAVKDPKSGKTLDKSFEGEHKKLTAGFAYEILGDGQATSEQLSFRPTGGPNRNVRDGSARIEVLKGNSVVWNQKVKLSEYLPNTITKNGVTITNNNGTISVSTTSNGATADTTFVLGINQIAGHKMLISGAPTSASLQTFYLTDEWSGYTDLGKGVIFTQNALTSNVAFVVKAGVVIATPIVFTPIFTNLTQMFGAGNEPATINQFYELLPEGVDINAYNGGEIVDANYKSIKTTGFNQWDEQWGSGYINSSNQIGVGSAIYSKNYIPALPNVDYYWPYYLCAKYGINSSSKHFSIIYYDKDKKEISRTSVYTNSNENDWVKRTPSNCSYIRFYANLFTTYNNDICINISWDEYSALNGQYKPYKPFERDLSWLAKYFPNGMRSAGNVADEIRFNSTTQQWEAVQRVGVKIYTDAKSIQSVNQYGIVNVVLDGGNVSDSKYTNTLFNSLSKQNTLISETQNEGYYIVNLEDSFSLYVRLSANKIGGETITAVNTYLSNNPIIVNYDLLTPDVKTITEDINLAYDVADYGTEQLIVAEGAQSAPLSAEVVYEPNVLASIKQVAAMLTRLDALETAVATMQASAVATTNEE